MKSLRSVLLGGVAVLLLVMAPKASAAPGSVELLRQAYVTLARADHDYHGHRVAAMHQIEAAARELGRDIRGDGRGLEKQGVSDQQLRAAQELLQNASAGLSGKPLKHLRAAERQLATALRIR